MTHPLVNWDVALEVGLVVLLAVFVYALWRQVAR